MTQKIALGGRFSTFSVSTVFTIVVINQNLHLYLIMTFLIKQIIW